MSQLRAFWFCGQAITAQRDRFGFSLVELVIVVLILAILATVSVPKIIHKSHEAELISTYEHLMAIAQAAENHYAQNGTWPTYTAAINAPGDFNGFLSRSAFTNVVPIASGPTPEQAKPFWFYWKTDTSELAYVGLPFVDPEVAIQLDEQYDDGNGMLGTIRYADHSAQNYVHLYYFLIAT